MQSIFNLVAARPNCPISASDAYRMLNAHRDKESWCYLIGEIYGNQLADDKDAPVTSRGSGKKGDPIRLRLSEEWDPMRNWDKEHEQF
jgi:hypothetical protein